MIKFERFFSEKNFLSRGRIILALVTRIYVNRVMRVHSYEGFSFCLQIEALIEFVDQSEKQ